MIEYLPRQSNGASFGFTDQLLGEDDGQPLWSTVPTSLVVTYSFVDRRGMKDLAVSSDDGTGQVVLDDNGLVIVRVTSDHVGALSEGLYDIYEKIVIDDTTLERIYARLPVFEGAK